MGFERTLAAKTLRSNGGDIEAAVDTLAERTQQRVDHFDTHRSAASTLDTDMTQHAGLEAQQRCASLSKGSK